MARRRRGPFTKVLLRFPPRMLRAVDRYWRGLPTSHHIEGRTDFLLRVIAGHVGVDKLTGEPQQLDAKGPYYVRVAGSRSDVAHVREKSRAKERSPHRPRGTERKRAASARVRAGRRTPAKRGRGTR